MVWKWNQKHFFVEELQGFCQRVCPKNGKDGVEGNAVDGDYLKVGMSKFKCGHVKLKI